MQDNPSIVDRLCEKFAQAFYHRSWPGELAPSVTHLTMQQAYAVQDGVSASRIGRGEKAAGYKIGCTSAAIRKQFGLTEPIFARLFHPHVLTADKAIARSQFVNCAIEPEMVFSTNRELRGVGLSEDELLKAIDWVSVGIELHHFKFWFEPPTSQELICSGGIHAGLILGNARVDPRQLSFGRELFSVHRDGRLVTQGRATEIMGGPLQSLRWLVDALSCREQCLPANSLVIPGSPVELVPIDHDCEIGVTIEGVGEVKAAFVH